MLLYPNPAKDFVTITNLPYGALLMIVFYINGKVIISKIANTETGRIDTSNFPNSVYFLRFDHNGYIIHKKLIVNKLQLLF
ncbi:T9SS type A sorting domain-containing protein [Gelidibacter sediminis]|uniref:T9SS type A sorting domain-containing protein n=1 Tax=Gelidibacter sediminis TaxID=1608710 RepID=UPI002938D333|nr:T9SS type A sorting domain-containing protein [Gelidibacter sediminis]